MVWTVILVLVVIAAMESIHHQMFEKSMQEFMEEGERNTKADGESRDAKIRELFKLIEACACD